MKLSPREHLDAGTNACNDGSGLRRRRAGAATWPMFGASVCLTGAFAISITRYRLMELDKLVSSGAVPSDGGSIRVRPENPESLSFSTPTAITRS